MIAQIAAGMLLAQELREALENLADGTLRPGAAKIPRRYDRRNGGFPESP